MENMSQIFVYSELLSERQNISVIRARSPWSFDCMPCQFSGEAKKCKIRFKFCVERVQSHHARVWWADVYVYLYRLQYAPLARVHFPLKFDFLRISNFNEQKIVFENVVKTINGASSRKHCKFWNLRALARQAHNSIMCDTYLKRAKRRAARLSHPQRNVHLDLHAYSDNVRHEIRPWQTIFKTSYEFSYV